MSARYLTLRLTLAQARGLAALAGEGAEGLFSDAAAARAYVGGASAQAAAARALSELHRAILLEPGERERLNNAAAARLRKGLDFYAARAAR